MMSFTSLTGTRVIHEPSTSSNYLSSAATISDDSGYVHCSLFTVCGDACPLSCVSAEACLTGWPNA